MILLEVKALLLLLVGLTSSSLAFQLTPVNQRATTRLAANDSNDEFFSSNADKFAKGAAMFLFSMGAAAQISLADIQPAIKEPIAPFGITVSTIDSSSILTAAGAPSSGSYFSSFETTDFSMPSYGEATGKSSDESPGSDPSPSEEKDDFQSKKIAAEKKAEEKKAQLEAIQAEKDRKKEEAEAKKREAQEKAAEIKAAKEKRAAEQREKMEAAVRRNQELKAERSAPAVAPADVPPETSDKDEDTAETKASISLPNFDTEEITKPALPKFNAPKFSIPKFDLPESKPVSDGDDDAPEVTSFETPKFEAPKFETPKFNTPKFNIPKLDLPESKSVPDSDDTAPEAPSLDTPKFEAPKFEFNTPKLDIPKFEAPKFEFPEKKAAVPDSSPGTFSFDTDDEPSTPATPAFKAPALPSFSMPKAPKIDTPSTPSYSFDSPARSDAGNDFDAKQDQQDRDDKAREARLNFVSKDKAANALEKEAREARAAASTAKKEASIAKDEACKNRLGGKILCLRGFGSGY